jgi:hypothetical protein
VRQEHYIQKFKKKKKKKHLIHPDFGKGVKGEAMKE